MGRTAGEEALPAELARGRRRFERWRRTRTQRRIPDDLWEEAVELARTFGVTRTARVLRLNVQSLRERQDSLHVASAGLDASSSPFVEVPALSLASPPAGVVVLESPDGARMRIEVAHDEVLDIRALALAFLVGE